MWVWLIVVVLVVAGVAVVATGRWGGMDAIDTERPDALVPAGRHLTADDLRDVRFSTGLRGYRMDEVDALLDRLAVELATRDDVHRALLDEDDVDDAGGSPDPEVRDRAPADGQTHADPDTTPADRDTTPAGDGEADPPHPDTDDRRD